MNIFVDAKASDDVRRKELYNAAVFVQPASPYALKLCQLAKEMIEETFDPLDPLTLHETMPVEGCVEKLAALKPQFIHHPKSKKYIQGILSEAGCEVYAFLRHRRTCMTMVASFNLIRDLYEFACRSGRIWTGRSCREAIANASQT
ncbi:MAG: hypothetical protein WBQ89_14570 [Candidatus Acidiferrum sp.]